MFVRHEIIPSPRCADSDRFQIPSTGFAFVVRELFGLCHGALGGARMVVERQGGQAGGRARYSGPQDLCTGPPPGGRQRPLFEVAHRLSRQVGR